MSDYIKRETVINSLDKLCDRVCQYSKAQRYVMCGACPLGNAFTVIEDDIPSADVEERKAGEWKTGYHKRNGLNYAIARCSECTYVVDVLGYKYCPNCGARMVSE